MVYPVLEPVDGEVAGGSEADLLLVRHQGRAEPLNWDTEKFVNHNLEKQRHLPIRTLVATSRPEPTLILL